MKPTNALQFITPDWPAPGNVRAFSTTRIGGVSPVPFDSFNLASHVGDDPQNVQTNRERLMAVLDLPSPPSWLEQIHSDKVINLPAEQHCSADASYTSQNDQVCVVMTADCLPVIFTNRQGTEIAAAHAGWRGLADGILENTISRFSTPTNQLIAWMGPAISVSAFEVGEEVREIFVSRLAVCESAFIAGSNGKWFADLYQLARLRLRAVGLTEVYGGNCCTFSDAARFYSYRRDGQTGRMATLIWLS